MLKNFNKSCILIYGPPGSGKGTQAKLLADRMGLFHLDTGDYLRKILYDLKLQKNKTIKKERKLNELGKLNTPSFVLKLVSQRASELFKLKQSIVFSGSPRTLFEAFGTDKTRGLMDILNKGCGKKNIFIFILKISEKESIKRNTKRLVCSTCKSPLLNPEFQRKGFKFKVCPFCGGKVIQRIDDNKKIMLIRLKQYEERTKPIFKELRKRKYKLHEIDGSSMPHKVHQTIVGRIKG